MAAPSSLGLGIFYAFLGKMPTVAGGRGNEGCQGIRAEEYHRPALGEGKALFSP